MSTASRKNRPESLSIPAALGISIFKISFKTLFSEVYSNKNHMQL